MWTWRRIARIKRTDTASNEELLRVQENGTVLKIRKRERERNWMGHIMRVNGILMCVLKA